MRADDVQKRTGRCDFFVLLYIYPLLQNWLLSIFSLLKVGKITEENVENILYIHYNWWTKVIYA